MSDRYSHLRANLELHRAATSMRTHTWWCTECQLHQADDSGLCPMCRPDEPEPRSVAHDGSAA